MGDFEHRFSGGNGNFIVFAKAARMIGPAKGTLDNPAPRKLFPFVRLNLFRYIYIQVKFLPHFPYKSAAIACVGAKPLNARILFYRFAGRENTRFGVMYICCVHCYGKQISHDIDYNMSLTAFRFFPPSIPLSSLSATVLTLCESISP